MIIGLGSDIVNIERVAALLKKSPEKFKNKYFTAYEIEAANRYGVDNKQAVNAHFAKRFAAKEAFAKAVGTGFGKDLNLKDIGVENDASGKPSVILNENAQALLKKKSGGREVVCHVSISDEYPYALAVVIIEAVIFG